MHVEHFPAWIRKFVRRTLQETLKIPDAAIFGGESPEESLKDAIQFWSEWLAKDKIWDKDRNTANLVYDELILKIVEDVREVDLSYRVVAADKQEGDAASSDAPGNQVAFEANNEKHQQYLTRIADFLDVFVPKANGAWLLKWIPQLSEVIIKKAMETPRIPRLYQMLATLMQVCTRYFYFEENSDERLNVLQRLLAFFKDLAGRCEEYQDDLLISCMHLLLKVPIALLFDSGR